MAQTTSNTIGDALSNVALPTVVASPWLMAGEIVLGLIVLGIGAFITKFVGRWTNDYYDKWKAKRAAKKQENA